jgi:hypothetical protein
MSYTIAKRPVHRLIPSALISERARRDPNGRPIIVGIHPDGTLTFRLKGTRAELDMHVLHAYELARRAAARLERGRRRKARQMRRLEAMLARAYDKPHPLHSDDPRKLARPRARRRRKASPRRIRK